MNYQQFVIVVKDKVALALGEGMSLQLHTALKNNGVKHSRFLCLQQEGQGSP